MDKELLRKSFNRFLKLYFDSCKEIYKEIGMETKLSSKQFYYLGEIHKSENITSTELAKQCQLSKPTITEIVNRFVNLELVEKIENPSDRRVQYLKLTEKGVLLASTNKLESLRVTEKIQDKLSLEEQEALVSLFDTVTGE